MIPQSAPITAPLFDPVAAFVDIVDWIATLARDKNAPGMIVGISGTDSILAFLACAKAFEKIGRGDRVLGIHYGSVFPPADKTAADIERIVSINPSYRWVARTMVPWLQAQAPQAQVVVDDSIDFTCDHSRWAALFRSSLNGASRTEMLDSADHYWVVGTRNATEQALSTYSNLSGAVSLQPLINLWKSDILKIWAAMGVPQLALDKSRQVDCDCGRYDLAADHIDEVDMILQARQGLIPAAHLAEIAPDLLAKLEEFVTTQIAYAGFKSLIPYCPPPRGQ